VNKLDGVSVYEQRRMPHLRPLASRSINSNRSLTRDKGTT